MEINNVVQPKKKVDLGRILANIGKKAAGLGLSFLLLVTPIIGKSNGKLKVQLKPGVLTGCDNGTTYNCTHCNDEGCPICNPNPGDVFGVTFANLEGKAIVINFPNGFDATEQATLMTRLQNIVGRLDTKAEEDAAFKTKVNALLGKGLTIIIEDIDTYGIKEVGGKLYISTEFFNSNNNNAIAGDIIDMVNDGVLAKAQQLNAIRMAEAPVDSKKLDYASVALPLFRSVVELSVR